MTSLSLFSCSETNCELFRAEDIDAMPEEQSEQAQTPQQRPAWSVEAEGDGE